ncbi:uncharacterized protein K441DRAFT_319534 [Cenococcum geophilum 1.58]|uniref:uncharacterized protein n=1 Tax=Cenococcum geophilum 1.58 TaxID=794803 RepID=UPI00358ECA00|nr:hypothetical protein K441DRAFT_319534 [Cenococcum geophilum 1.58]
MNFLLPLLSMQHIMKHRCLVSLNTAYTPSPVFSPTPLCQHFCLSSIPPCHASGNINIAKPSPSILAIAQSVPHPIRLLGPSSKCPLWAQKATEISPEIDPTTIEPPKTPIPWELWDQGVLVQKNSAPFHPLRGMHLPPFLSTPPVTEHS